MKRKIAGPLVIAVLAMGMFVMLKRSYGSFNHYYYVKVDMPRAGQLLRTGTDVRIRGVIIGEVSKIELVNLHAQLTLQIDPKYRIPRDARAFVDLKTLLGDKYVDLRMDQFSGPWLSDGDTIQGQVGPELEDVVQAGTDVFSAIDPSELATVVGQLSEAARGHGADIARNIMANARLSTVFASTLRPQIRALNDFVIIFGALKNKGVDLNELADAVNQGVPVYASDRAHAALRRALIAVRPFADNLADLLIFQKPQWDQMMDAGDRVLGALAADPRGLHSLIHGLYIYVSKLGGDPPLLSDGSAQAPFTDFTSGGSFEETVGELCGTLPPPLRKQIPICGMMAARAHP